MKDSSHALPRCRCGGAQYERIFDGHYDRLGADHYAFAVYRCGRCGLARTHPVPDTSQYSAGFALTTSDGRFVGAFEDPYSESIADAVRGRVPSGRFLDVGCGVGSLVMAAKERGFQAVGVDLDPIATAEGRRLGRPVRTGSIADVRGEFDAIVLNHVLEHVLDLSSFLRQVEARLAPGGSLFLFVPHYRGVLPRVMRERWMGWVPMQHVWHFTPETLSSVVTRATSLEELASTARGAIEPPSHGIKGWIKRAVTTVAARANRGDEIEAVFGRAPRGAPTEVARGLS
jgi:2-polyprenyl-3-methyl-5-hydroxy-6-metoxy-1,4-benzoquinol methylase